MSGHSKWSTIKHKKAAKDAKRGKIFTKLIREITVAARGGSDLNSNPRLRTAVANAKAVSMPADNIDRAIKKGSGELEGEMLHEVDYEGYGPGGIAILVRTLTDNKNRTVGDIRHTFSRNGGNLGESNCVAWMFHRKGVLEIEKAGANEEALMERAIEAGADDFGDEGEVFEVTTTPETFEDVREALEAAGAKLRSAEITMVPESTVELSGDQAAGALKLLDLLEDLDDVQSVSANLDIDPEELERLSAA